MKKVLCVFMFFSLFFCLFSSAGTSDVFADNETILCVGDSITWGSGSSGKLNGVQSNTYPQRLAALLNNGSVTVNYGVSGLSVLPDPASNRVVTGGAIYHATIRNSLRRSDADIVLLMLGTNDAKLTAYNSGTGRTEPGVWDSSSGGAQNFKSAYKDLVRRYLNMSSHPVVYCIIPPPCLPEGTYGRSSYRINERILRDEICPCIRAVANELNCPLIDLREPFPSPLTDAGISSLSGYLVDCVHPNPTGYALLSQTIRDKLLGIETPPPAPEQAPQTPTPDIPPRTEAAPVTTVPEYTLSFDLNGIKSYAQPEALHGQAGSEVTLPAPEKLVSNAGQTLAEFLGWALLPGMDPIYLPGDRYVFPARNDTLFAIWETYGPYQVRYTDPDEILYELPADEREYVSGELLTLPLDYDLSYDRTNYDFSGWSYEQGGEPISDLVIEFPNHNLDLYANFTKITQDTLDPQPPQDETPIENSAFPLIPVIAGGVLLIASAAVCVFLYWKRRKRQTNGETSSCE